MRIITIVSNCYREKVLNQLEGLVQYFREQGVDLTTVTEDELIEVYVSDNEVTERIVRLANYYIANIIYEVFIENFISKKLSKHLGENYSFLSCNEIAGVKEEIVDVLNENTEINDTVLYCMNRKNYMLDKIYECIVEGDSINIKGFLNFRFKELEGELLKSVEKVVERFVAEKEYNEFISLLKYFVEVQDSKLDRVDIYIGGENEYDLRDQYGNDMLKSLAGELCENKNMVDISSEDLVISGLITTCPKKIVIHKIGECKNKELLNTIKKVFEDRVEMAEDKGEKREIKDFIKIPIDTHVEV